MDDVDLDRLRAGRQSRFTSVLDQILHPFVLGGIGVLVAATSGGHDLSSGVLARTAAILLVAVGGPILVLRMSLRTGRLSDHQAVRRHERGPLLITGGLCLLAAGALAVWLGVPHVARYLGLGVLATLIATVITRYVTKVSLHTTAAAALATVVARYHLVGGIVLGAVTVTLLIWSRTRQGRHTLPQTVLGIIVGVTVFVLY